MAEIAAELYSDCKLLLQIIVSGLGCSSVPVSAPSQRLVEYEVLSTKYIAGTFSRLKSQFLKSHRAAQDDQTEGDS